MREAKKENLIITYIENIINFIHRSTSDTHCEPAVLKGSIGLLGDLGVAFGTRMAAIFNQPYVLQMLQEGRQYEDMSQIVSWTQGVMIYCIYLYLMILLGYFSNSRGKKPKLNCLYCGLDNL